jgi:hypothetical protein
MPPSFTSLQCPSERKECIELLQGTVDPRQKRTDDTRGDPNGPVAVGRRNPPESESSMGARCFQLELPEEADANEFEALVMNGFFPTIGSSIQNPDGTTTVSDRSVVYSSINARDLSTVGTALHRLFKFQTAGSLDLERIVNPGRIQYVWLTFQVLPAPDPRPRAKLWLNAPNTDCTELVRWFVEGFPGGAQIRLNFVPACSKFTEVTDSAGPRLFGFSVLPSAGDFVGSMTSIFTHIGVAQNFGLHRLLSGLAEPLTPYIWLPFSVVDQGARGSRHRDSFVVQLASAVTTCEDVANWCATAGQRGISCAVLQEVVYPAVSSQISAGGVLSSGGQFDAGGAIVGESWT